MGDVVEMKIGNALCNRFDSMQSTLSRWWDYLQCRMENMEAGKYKVSEKVRRGVALNH